MSYLNGPRINFWGGGSTNVDTANNTNYKSKDHPAIVDLVDAMVRPGQTDEQLIHYLREHAENKDKQPYYTNGGWNYYGDHQVAFMDVTVSSSGMPGGVNANGELVGMPVYLLGSVDPVSGDGPYGGPVMVDLDPTSSQSTQIYVGGLQIGDGNPVLLARHDTACHSRFLGLRYDSSGTHPPYLTPGSVFGSGTFQFAFPKEAIISYDENVQILGAIINDPRSRGIVVRFSMFEFMPGMSTNELQYNYDTNRNDSNPSLGRIIGTIGAWYDDEPATCPPGRYLQRFVYNEKAGEPVPVSTGLAHVDVDARLLTLDLVSTLPGAAIRQNGRDNTGPIGPNVDYGDLQIGTGEGALASTPSLPDDYYLFGGLYDVPLSGSELETLANSPIVITSTENELSIREMPLRIYSDDRNVYINEVGDDASISLQVRELGGPVRSDTQIRLDTGPSGGLDDAGFLIFPANITVPAGSTGVDVPVGDNGGKAGFLALNFTSGESRYFVNFRKYPDDDFSAAVDAGEIPWEGADGVYEQCLRFYYVLFPGMSKRIPLNDQATMRAVAGEVLKRISALYRNTTMYMPLTRSMSPGKVAYLAAYLKQFS